MQKITKKSAWLNVLSITAAWIVIMAVFIVNTLFVRKIAPSSELLWVVFCMAVHVLLLLVVMFLFVMRFRHHIAASPKSIATLYALFTISYVVCLFVNDLSSFAMPITLAAMLVCVFFDSRVGFCVNVFSAVTLLSSELALNFSTKSEPSVVYVSVILTGLIVGTLITLFMGRDTKRISFVMCGIGLNFLGAALVVLYGLIRRDAVFTDPIELTYLSSYILLPVFLSMMLQPIMERILNVTSNFRFVELADPKHPLLMRLAQEAPGTYNHSLTVANLVETCANAIGENVYLARCAAYYHDIGKLSHPRLFAENQSDGANPHDELTPEASTDIIRKHTINGERLCREYHIPEPVTKIAREHHGTTVIYYFYDKAKKMTDGREVDVRDYSYPGPVPSTKIAALVMICDSCEAAVRAMGKPEAKKVDDLVAKIIRQRMDAGQFDDCPITMQDLRVVRETIVNSICGLYHERIKYPEYSGRK